MEKPQLGFTGRRPDLVGRVAIVTGAGSRGDGIGNGRASAILLARAGAQVLLLDEKPDWAEQTAAMIAADGGEAAVMAADVTVQDDCRAAVAEAARRFGRLDILVNNVGVGGPPGTAETVDLDLWRRGLEINVTSMMLMSKFAVPEMRRIGGGSIVNIASVAGLLGGHPSLLYPTSKGAVINMSRAMAAQHGRDLIRVNCIAPGMVYTPMVYSHGMSDELRQARRRRSLLKTEGTGWDVGSAVVFLASDEARWITGIVLPVDAGATAGSAPVDTPINR